MKNLPVKIRTIRSTDHSLIHDSWSKTAKKMHTFVDGRLFQTGMNQRIEKALKLCEETHGGVVCHDPEDEEQIFAFQVVTVPVPSCAVIEFAFTKSFYWKLGLQKKMFDSIEATTKIVASGFPALYTKEFHNDGKPLILHLRDKHGVVFDPFFHERVNR